MTLQTTVLRRVRDTNYQFLRISCREVLQRPEPKSFLWVGEISVILVWVFRTVHIYFKSSFLLDRDQILKLKRDITHTCIIYPLKERQSKQILLTNML